MDIQLNELIEKIKKDGIASAKAEAGIVIADAQAEANRIIEAAKLEADAISARAKADAARSEKACVAAIEQAYRDLTLAFKSGLQRLLDSLTVKTVASAYTADIIKAILPDLIKSWAEKGSDSLTVVLSKGDLEKLDSAFISMLASTLRGGVEIKAVKKLDSGFRIIEKDGSAFYDFSAESIAIMLSAYLNPKLVEILNRAG